MFSCTESGEESKVINSMGELEAWGARKLSTMPHIISVQKYIKLFELEIFDAISNQFKYHLLCSFETNQPFKRPEVYSQGCH
jgi:hypothetical protein